MCPGVQEEFPWRFSVSEPLLSLSPVRDPGPLSGVLRGGTTHPVAHPCCRLSPHPSSHQVTGLLESHFDTKNTALCAFP